MGEGAFFAAYLIITVAFAIGAYFYASSMASDMGKAPVVSQMTPDPRKDLQVTTTAEGIVAPVVYGTVRLTGNIMYYGGLYSAVHYVTQYVTQTSGGGKGGGSDPEETTEAKQVAQGYDYWLNVWEGICMGPVEILAMYVGDNKNKTITAATTTFNDGTTGAYPSWTTGGTYSGTLPAVEGPVQWVYSLGHSYISPGTFECAVPFRFSASMGLSGGVMSSLISSLLHDNGAGNLVNAAGAVVPGCYIDYTAGELRTDSNFAGGLYNYSYGSDPNALLCETPLPGLAHIAWEQWALGTEAYNIPNVSFVVKKTMPTTINYANMTNGANPAAIIYDIMTNTTYGIGMPVSELNIASFNAAATVWYGKGYGLNFALNQQNEAQALIEQILGWVGGSFFIDNNGKFCIYAYSDSDTAVTTLTEDDFVDFSITRQSWSTTINDLRIKYIDAGCDFVAKTIGLFDNSNYQVQDIANQKAIDLSCFQDSATVSKRAWELLKTMSYPILTIKFKLNETKSYPIFAGAIVEINHADYGISHSNYRINNMSIGEDNQIEVEYSAEQVVEDIFDSEYSEIKTQVDYWTFPDYTPVKLPYSKIFELPWNPTTKNLPYYLFLGARAGEETVSRNVKSIVSATSDFDTIQSYRAFSQYGTLNAIYPATTYAIDDEVGIIYTPYRDDPQFADVRRANLFSSARLVLIDSELMVFQYQLPYGTGSQYQLMGVIRGVFNTTIASHAISAPIWICLADAVSIPINDATPFWIKMVPANNTNTVDVSTITAIAVTPTQKATTPAAPYMMEATRDGSNNITLIWYPHVREYTGAGFTPENITTDSWPFDFDGDFEYSIDSATGVVIADCTYSFTQAGSLTFAVRHKINGIYSSWLTLTVGASAGTYLTEVGAVTY